MVALFILNLLLDEKIIWISKDCYSAPIHNAETCHTTNKLLYTDNYALSASDQH